jgi:hypothetical protein
LYLHTGGGKGAWKRVLKWRGREEEGRLDPGGSVSEGADAKQMPRRDDRKPPMTAQLYWPLYANKQRPLHNYSIYHINPSVQPRSSGNIHPFRLSLLHLLNIKALPAPCIANHFFPFQPSTSMQAALLFAAWAGAVSAALGVMEVDLVFPRNETYAPTKIFPVIIAIQNPELAPFLNPTLSVDLTNLETQAGISAFYDLRWTNFSGSSPFHQLKVFSNFNEEGSWRLNWEVSWDSCTESSLEFAGTGIATNRTSHATWFAIKNAAHEIDLVDATANRVCKDEEAVAINVAATLEVPDHITWKDYGGKTCASMASTTPAPTPCQVKFDSAAASNISASMTSLYCEKTRVPGSSCPTDDKSSAERLVGGGIAGLVTVFGILGYMMV